MVWNAVVVMTGDISVETTVREIPLLLLSN